MTIKVTESINIWEAICYALKQRQVTGSNTG